MFHCWEFCNIIYFFVLKCFVLKPGILFQKFTKLPLFDKKEANFCLLNRCGVALFWCKYFLLIFFQLKCLQSCKFCPNFFSLFSLSFFLSFKAQLFQFLMSIMNEMDSRTFLENLITELAFDTGINLMSHH